MKRIIPFAFAILGAVLVFSAAAEPDEIVYIGGAYTPSDKPVLKPFFDRYFGESGALGDRALPVGADHRVALPVGADHRAARAKRIRIVKGMDALTTADLANARTVIVSGGKGYGLTDHERAVLDALVDYVRQGGGLVIESAFQQMFSHTEFQYQLMKAFGGEILYEGVVTPKARCVRIGEWDPDTWAVTTKVDPLFAKGGVKRVLYRTPFLQDWEYGIVPFKTTADWKVALATEADVTAKPFKPFGLALLDARIPPEATKGEVPVVGYREFGKGRVVWYGISCFLTRSVAPNDAANTETANRILWDGAKGMGPVETGRFLANMFDWVGGGGKLKLKGEVEERKNSTLPLQLKTSTNAHPLVTAAAMDRALGTDYHLYKGVIGPRTTLSSGKSTPEEFIARAKALGHDFIVFLEDFAALSPENFEKLRAICEKATDKTFSAWPGYQFRKDNGNCQFVFGTDPLYPGKKWLASNGREFISVWKSTPENGYKPNSDQNFAGSVDLGYFYSVLSFKNNRGWHMFHESPYRTTDNCNVQSMGVMTRLNGRTAETALDAYIDNVQQGYQLWPMTLELTDAADLIGDDTYLTYCGANGLAEFRRLMIEYGVNSGIQGHANFGLQSTSNGPVIEFRSARAHYSGDTNILYSAEFRRWPYELRVSSPNGLDAIELWDAGALVRRWKANGAKTFVRKGSFACEKQHYYWVKVKDLAGKSGLTRPADSHTFVLRENCCSDRNNLLFYSDQIRPDGTHQLGNYSAETALPNHIIWPPRIKPVGYFTLDKKYGVGELSCFDGSPEDHPALWMSPSVEYGGKPAASLGWVREFVAGREGGPHCFPRRVIASSDALVGDRLLDGVYAYGRKPLTHGCQGLHPVYDSKFADTCARTSLFTPKLDGICAYQWEQQLTLKAPVPSKAGKAIVNWGFTARSSKAAYIDASVGGVRVTNCLNKTFPMKPGDYLVIKNPVYGSLAVYPLAPIQYAALSWKTPGDGSTYPAGTVFRANFVFVGMHKFVKDPYAHAGEIAKAYGIGEGKVKDEGQGQVRTDYSFKLTAGRGWPNGVCFDAVADNGVFAGTASGLKALPGTLGLRLSGLNDRQAVVVESPKGLRLVSSVEGTAYVALRDEEEGALFVGHPFVCDNPDVVLALSQPQPSASAWRLEVHNPTDAPVTVKLATDKRLRAFSYAGTLTLAPGESKDLDLN